MENIEMNIIEEPVLAETEITAVSEVPEVNTNADIGEFINEEKTQINITPEQVPVKGYDLAGKVTAFVGGFTVLALLGYGLYEGGKWAIGRHENRKAKRAAKKEAKKQAKIVKIETVPEQNKNTEEFEEVDD